MPDPITALKRFDDDSTPVPALPPEEVRRRGDRLRRRNRAALAGAAVLAVVAGTVGVSAAIGNDGPAHVQPAPAPTSTPSKAPQMKSGTLRPDGLGKLRLGMSVAEVEATGQATVKGTPGEFACAGLQFTDYPTRAHTTDGYVSKELGLEAIAARPGMTTPEGIGPGSTVAEAKAAYPGGRHHQGHWLRANGYLVVPLDHGREYEFGIESDHTVGETLLTVSRSNCFG